MACVAPFTLNCIINSKKRTKMIELNDQQQQKKTNDATENSKNVVVVGNLGRKNEDTEETRQSALLAFRNGTGSILDKLRQMACKFTTF
uniref:Uncharacterized protein n=1 Tax=Romanomermis culicivorax TaxID=13658 RepID=A0A915K6V6_ROMCU